MIPDVQFYAVIAGMSLVPLISVRYVAGRYLDAARDMWLVALGWMVSLLLCVTALPIGLAGFAVLFHWRSWKQLPAVMTWVGIAATWLVMQSLPEWATALLPIGWRITVGGVMLLGFALMQKRRKQEIKAGTGTRIMLAALLALVWPFTSWWEWPLYAYGFWLTSSWVALLALFVAVALRYPITAPYVVVGLATVVLLFSFRWTRVHILDYTPRGSSFDGLIERWRTWCAVVRLARRWPVWLLGSGPNPADAYGPSLQIDLTRESVRLFEVKRMSQSLVHPIHCEPLEYAYTYGLMGIAAMGALAWQVGTRLSLGDPWSASAAAGLVVALAAIPARVAPVGVVWLVVLAVMAGR